MTGSATGEPASFTRAEGLRRLADFLPRAGHAYAAGRNEDRGPGRHDAVSLLSPYLRHRLITEREVVAAVLEEHGRDASKFVDELLWRTYWKGWLELRPSVWRDFLAERDLARDEAERSGLASAVARAEAGETGIEGFDDWARELADTGYLHNHARMWFASIWIFTLRLPWTLGADVFLRHLLDADPASNTLSWRWVAGIQTQGKPYLAIAGNIARFTAGRFSPKGLADRAFVVPASPPREPQPLRKAAAMPEGPALLLVTGEDMHPESLLPHSAEIAAVLAAGRIGGGGWPFGPRAATFTAAGLHDAAARASAAFACTARTAPHLGAGTVIDAAQAARVRTVVTSYAPVGPTADALEAMQPALEAAGLSLVRLRRPWDERFWPKATKGFFPFRESIPALLAEEGLRI